MTSYKGLLNKIEAFCNAHLQIKKYGGEFKEQMPNFSTEDEKYPIVYVVPTSDLSDLNTNQFTLDVYCVDIIQKDRANINTIVSDCNLIVNDLYLYFLDGNDLSIDVIGASNGSPINNFDLDYSAGWVKSITFEVQAYSVCAIPMNPINPNPPQVCNPANYNLVDTLDNILSSGSIDSGVTENIVVGNSTVENSDGSYSASVLAEGSLVLPDITVDVTNSALTVVNTATVSSVQDVTISAPDGTIENSDATFTASVPSGTNYTLTDETVEIYDENNTLIDTVTFPTLGDAEILLSSYCPTPSPRSTATLMKTGQTTSYRTGDDGDLEAGRATNFLTLDTAPLHNNGSATLNTTTNRFTDELGGQTYANNIVLDWSTWNGSTLLGYRRTENGVDITWNNAIDNALALNIAGFTPWRLPNRNELSNLWNGESTLGYNYSPINLNTAGRELWTGNSLVAATTLAWFNNTTYGQEGYKAKTTTTNSRYIPVRTFSLSTSNVLS